MMKKMILAVVVAAAFGAASANAQCPGPGCPGGGAPAFASKHGAAFHGHPFFAGVSPHANHPIKGHPLFAKDKLALQPTLPVYMAAPWYQYWPYDGHFQTVAPMAYGVFYPPPVTNVPANPFMPASYPSYVPGAQVPYIPTR
jgi:hypothetical protein